MSDPAPTQGGPDQANPYIAGSPVTVPEMFFGREDIFAFVQQALVGRHRDNVIVLYGQRRTGKTSILHQLPHHLGSRYVCVFVDLHALALDGLGGALWELAASVTRVLRREYQIDIPRLERSDFLADPRGQFENVFLNDALAAVGDRHLLLMLDEVIRLQEQVEAGKLEPDIFVYVRHLMQYHERFSILFSLGSGLEEMSKDYALLFNIALYKKVSFLDRDSAVALVRRPVEDLYRVEPDAVERVLEITCGHPYFTQLICHSLFNRWQRHHTPQVGREDVDAILDEAVERGLAVLKHVWEDSSPSEKAVLASMAALSTGVTQPMSAEAIADVWTKRGIVLPERDLVGAIQSLLARDVIAGGDQYAFAVDLQRRWVRQYRRVEWVHEEIGAAARWPAPDAPAVGRSAATDDAPAAAVEPREAPPHSRAQTGVVSWAAVALGAAALLVAAVAVWTASQRAAPSAEPTPAPAAATALPPAATAAPTSAAPAAATAAPTSRPISVVVPAGDAALVNSLVAADGAVWAATDGGLVRWTPDGNGQLLTGPQGMSFGFPDDGRETLATASDGSLWIGGGGVAHVRFSGDRVLPLAYYDRNDGVGMGVVRILMVDADGSVWAGGAPDAGRPPPLSHFDGKPGPDGRLWRTSAIPLNDPALASVRLNIWGLYRAADGALWVGLAQDGMLRWDGSRWTHFPAGPAVRPACTDMRVRRFVADRQGTLWASASCQGLLRFDQAAGRWQRVSPGQEGAVHTLARFSSGDLWVAGPDLAARSPDDGRTWSVAATAADQIGTDTTAIIEGPDGRPWIADYGGGVSVLDGTHWRHLQRGASR